MEGFGLGVVETSASKDTAAWSHSLFQRKVPEFRGSVDQNWSKALKTCKRTLQAIQFLAEFLNYYQFYPCLSHHLRYSVLWTHMISAPHLQKWFSRVCFSTGCFFVGRFLSKESETSCHHRATNQRVGLANYQSGAQFSSEVCCDLGFPTRIKTYL